MRKFLDSPAARRTAWTTLVSLLAALGVPVTPQRAEAQNAARSAYLVPFTAEGAGIDTEIPQRVSSELVVALKGYRLDPRVKQPIELVTLNSRDPVIRQALDEGAISEDDLANPPTERDAALDFARRLGLTTVLVGSIEAYVEAADKSEASLEVTVFEYAVPADPQAEPSIARTVSRTIRQKARNERERALLRTNITERAALHIAAVLLEAPELAPPEPPEEEVGPKKKGPDNTLWIVLGVAAAVAGIFLLSTIGGGGSKASADLAVTGVTARSEADSVRITWDRAAGATGYNVYRRAVGNQPIRLRSRSRDTSGFTVLPNPETNTTPTVQGGGRTSFIDTTAVSGVIYEYAVQGVGAGNQVGELTRGTAEARAGANIGVAPVLTGASGNGFVSLSWSASSGFVDGYIIFRRQGGVPDTGVNSPDQLARIGNVTTFDDTTVSNGVAYTYIVQPITQVNVNQLLTGVDSNAVTVTPAAGSAPQAPRNVVGTVDANGRVLLSWSPNPESNIDLYEVLRKRDRRRVRVESGRTPWLRGLDASRAPVVVRSDPRDTRQIDLSGFQIVGTTDSTITNFTDGPLPDGTYIYAVRAVNRAGQRGPATATDPITVNAALAAPSGLRAVGLDSMVRLTWQPVAGDVQAYNIYRSNTPITAVQTSPATAPGIARVGQAPGNRTSFDDTSLTNNMVFYYAVTSVDSQGAESDFGKGDSPDTGVIGVPHPTPTQMSFTIDKQNISGNGKDTATATIVLRDALGSPTAGVAVDLRLVNEAGGAGTLVNLPPNATAIGTNGRQVRALTDAQGQVVIDVQSDVVTTAGQQVSVNLEAEAAELPDDVQLQSQTITFLASRPNVIILSPAQSQLVADNASTTDLTARVIDALGQPVPDNQFNVEFFLNTTNGSIRRSGNVQNNPFQNGPATVSVPVVNGRAVAVYKAGRDASTLGSPPANVIPIRATIAEDAAITAQTLVTLVPGAPAQVVYLDAGVQVTTVALGVQGSVVLPTSKTITVVVRDAQGNPVRDGINVTFTVDPTGLVSVPGSGTTNTNGEIDLQIAAGATPGGAVLTASISGTQVQSQLAITVQ